MAKGTKVALSTDALLLRIRKYCALRERSIHEVKRKLADLGAQEEELTLIIGKLMTEGFLNEKRFTKSFVGGKFRNKKWGRKKIEIELRKHGIKGEILEQGFKEIAPDDYLQTLDKLLAKKWKQVSLKPRKNEEEHYGLFTPEIQKVINYALQKGYEYEVIVERVKGLGLK
jgi:regulatory protein